MWPYSSDEHVWLDPSKDWSKGRLQPIPLPTAANDDNGAWPYAANDDVAVAEHKRPIDPQIFVGK